RPLLAHSSYTWTEQGLESICRVRCVIERPFLAHSRRPSWDLERPQPPPLPEIHQPTTIVALPIRRRPGTIRMDPGRRLMAQHFDARNAPFDRLTADEVEAVRDALDIAYFRPNETIVGRDEAPDSLFIVIKGLVEERDGDDLIALRGPGDAFDSRALVQGGGSHAFVAREETLCNLLPRDLTLRLIAQNPRFASFFYLDIARKLDRS